MKLYTYRFIFINMDKTTIIINNNPDMQGEVIFKTLKLMKTYKPAGKYDTAMELI